MPQYFFDVEDVELHPDGEGQELEGLNAARIAAVIMSGELLKSFPDRFWSVGRWQVSCRDEAGLILFVLHFWAQESAAIPKHST